MPEAIAAPRTVRIGMPVLLLWSALGIFANELEHVSQYMLVSPAMARKWDLADPTLHGTLVRLAGEAAMLLLGVLLMWTAAQRRPDLLEHPARFIAWILLAASAGFAVVRIVGVVAVVSGAPLWSVRLQVVLRDWTALMVWCTLFGWVLFLTLRRRADHARLAQMLMRRVLLTRQLAQSRLGAARAQVEPEMIAGVLRTVRVQAAASGGAQAGARPLLDPVVLIDHLATYLRLLLDRMRHGTPKLLTDLALVRSLVALREAETGVALELRVDPRVDAQGARSAMATFLVVRAMLDAVVQSSPARVRVALDVSEVALVVRVMFAGQDMSGAVRSRLADTLAGLRPGVGAVSHRFESGMHCHEVHVPLQ